MNELKTDDEKIKSEWWRLFLTIGGICGSVFFLLMAFSKPFNNWVSGESGCVTYEDIELGDDNTWYLKSTGEVFDGLLCDYNGEANFVNGKKEGFHSGYFSNEVIGNLFERFVYGLSRNFWDSKGRSSRHHYSNGKLNGKYEEWNTEGDLIAYGYYKMDERNGRFGSLKNGTWEIQKFEDNVLVELLGVPIDYPYLNPIKNVYHVDETEHLYNPEMLRWESNNSPVTAYIYDGYSNGKLKELSYFKNGLPDGIALGFYRNGNLKGKSIFSDGKKDGLCELYDKNGVKTEQCFFEKNEPTMETIYYPTGEKHEVTNFINGEPYMTYVYKKNGELLHTSMEVKPNQ